MTDILQPKPTFPDFLPSWIPVGLLPKNPDSVATPLSLYSLMITPTFRGSTCCSVGSSCFIRLTSLNTLGISHLMHRNSHFISKLHKVEIKKKASCPKNLFLLKIVPIPKLTIHTYLSIHYARTEKHTCLPITTCDCTRTIP